MKERVIVRAQLHVIHLATQCDLVCIGTSEMSWYEAGPEAAEECI